MLGFRFIKTKPTQYVLHFKKGKVKKQGAGLSFFYYAPSSNIVIVPAESKDIPFIFKETTSDFQEIDVQGQLTYRVKDPALLANLMDFSVNPRAEYIGDGIEKLPDRLTSIIQVIVREKLTQHNLVDGLKSAQQLISFAVEQLRAHSSIQALGIEVIALTILKLSPTPDMARALEARAREQLMKGADEAIYERRNFAVEQERKIKENELQTQIAIEEKNRQIREEKMNADIAVEEKKRNLEEKRMKTTEFLQQSKQELAMKKLKADTDLEKEKSDLVETRSKNTIEYAKAKSEALRLELSAISGLDTKTLEVLSANSMDAKRLISRALQEMAQNAEKIGNLNISPDLLNSLLETSANLNTPPAQQR